MKRILFLCYSMKIGKGTEMVMTKIANELSKNHRTYFLTLYDLKPYIKFNGKYESLNSKFEILNPILYPLKMLQYFYRAYKIKIYCKKNNITHIISSLEELNIPAIFSKIIFNNKINIFVSVHVNPQVYLKSKIKKMLILKTYRIADKVISISKYQEEILKKDFNLKNTEMIHNLIDLSEIKEKLREEISKEEREKYFHKKFTFITIARLVESKNLFVLFRCFRKIVEREKDTNLIVLGEGELKKDLEEFIEKLGLKDNIFLLGQKDNIYSYLKECDCFVFPTLSEAFGMVLLESLASNIPIISTDCISGPREILCPELEISARIKYPYYGKYGILTQPFLENEDTRKTLNEESLTKKEIELSNIMLNIINIKKLQKKYSKGLERAREFDIKNIIKNWKKL